MLDNVLQFPQGFLKKAFDALREEYPDVCGIRVIADQVLILDERTSVIGVITLTEFKELTNEDGPASA